MVARTFSSVPLAGSGRQARYSSTLLTAPIRPTDVPSLPTITFLIRKGLSQSEIESPAEFYRFIQSAIATRAPQNTTAATQNPNRPPRRCRTPPAAAISSDRNRKSSRVLSVHPERDCNQSPAKHHRRHPESQPAAAPLPHPAGSRNQFRSESKVQQSFIGSSRARLQPEPRKTPPPPPRIPTGRRAAAAPRRQPQSVPAGSDPPCSELARPLSRLRTP